MRKFYICTTGIAKGPFDVSEIDRLEIKSNDLIWSKQYFDTRMAIQVPEFREYFKKQQSRDKKEPQKKSLYQRVGVALLLSVLLLVLYFCYVAL